MLDEAKPGQFQPRDGYPIQKEFPEIGAKKVAVSSRDIAMYKEISAVIKSGKREGRRYVVTGGLAHLLRAEYAKANRTLQTERAKKRITAYTTRLLDEVNSDCVTNAAFSTTQLISGNTRLYSLEKASEINPRVTLSLHMEFGCPEDGIADFDNPMSVDTADDYFRKNGYSNGKAIHDTLQKMNAILKSVETQKLSFAQSLDAYCTSFTDIVSYHYSAAAVNEALYFCAGSTLASYMYLFDKIDPARAKSLEAALLGQHSPYARKVSEARKAFSKFKNKHPKAKGAQEMYSRELLVLLWNNPPVGKKASLSNETAEMNNRDLNAFSAAKVPLLDGCDYQKILTFFK